MNKLDNYQELGVTSIGTQLLTCNSVVAVSPTGSGKSVIIATIGKRFIEKNEDKSVIIFVHKIELLEQIREKFLSWYGIITQRIDSDTKQINSQCRVFVAMVETFNNRTKKHTFLSKFENVGLIMVDECHLSHFKKIFSHFPLAKLIGFTATPISANKKDPLCNYYKSIVIISKIKQLIQINEQNPRRGVVPAEEYSMKNVKREELKVKGEDFDEDYMGELFSNKRQIQNTIEGYIKIGYGKKTIIFNANVAHSLNVRDAFVEAGFNCKHVDGNCDKRYRKAIFDWFEKTDNAILCNVGIATIGTDTPSAEFIIVNKSTKSFTLWKQMIGRGGRPYEYIDGSFKEYFLVLDMGDNIEGGGMGFYDDDVDWEYIFNHPKLPKAGVSVVKSCPECGNLLSSTAKVCLAKVYDWLEDSYHECGYVFPSSVPQEDVTIKEFVRVTKGVDVRKNIEFFSSKGEYFAMYETIRQVINLAAKNITTPYLDAQTINGIVDMAMSKAKEWRRITGKRLINNLREDTKYKTISQLKENGFIIPVEEIEELEAQE